MNLLEEFRAIPLWMQAAIILGSGIYIPDKAGPR